MTKECPHILDTLTQEEFDAIVGLPEDVVREALQKGSEDLRKALVNDHRRRQHERR